MTNRHTFVGFAPIAASPSAAGSGLPLQVARRRAPWNDRSSLFRGKRQKSFALALVGSVVAALTLVAAAPSASTATGSHRVATALELGVLVRINDIRTAHGLVPLTLDSRLNAAATAHSHQMVVDGYFGHRTAAGLDFAERIAYYYPDAGTRFYAAGENLFWAGAVNPVGFSVVARWMQSPDHRANILSPEWRQIGVAAVTARSAPGVFHGQPVTVVTADFGVRS
jgi:uncharacterized protein YkwD